MTIHVSLPKELEGMVHAHVESGMYQSASEVVREALRGFFNQGNDVSISDIHHIREIIAPRLKAVKSGEAELLDTDAVFSEIDNILRN